MHLPINTVAFERLSASPLAAFHGSAEVGIGIHLSLTYLPGTQRSSRLANRGAVTLSVRAVFPVGST